MVLTCVARLFPHLNCVILLVGNRISPAVFQQRMEAMAITGMRLQVGIVISCCMTISDAAAIVGNAATAAAPLCSSSALRPWHSQA
jgi:hypothetical protein